MVKYIPRNYENSGPDYLGGSISGAVPNGLLFMTNTEVSMNIGYVKNDGWVIFPTTKEGTGFNLSVGAQITAGWYIGSGTMSAGSMEGLGLYTNYSRSAFSSSLSVGLDEQGRPSWTFISLGAGKGIPKSMKWSTQTGVSNTAPIHYFRTF